MWTKGSIYATLITMLRFSIAALPSLDATVLPVVHTTNQPTPSWQTPNYSEQPNSHLLTQVYSKIISSYVHFGSPSRFGYMYTVTVYRYSCWCCSHPNLEKSEILLSRLSIILIRVDEPKVNNSWPSSKFTILAKRGSASISYSKIRPLYKIIIRSVLTLPKLNSLVILSC